MTEPIQLAQRPTPVERLERMSRALGVELWVKRDDLTGLGLSGNKVRKLERLLGRARAEGADTVITCGGIQSNHCRATVVACRRLGLHPVVLLRGEEQGAPQGNLLLDRLLDAEIHFCTPQVYRDRRGAEMQRLAEESARSNGGAFIIPEGGSNGLGALAFVDASREVQEQLPGTLDGVVVAVGSGGTLAGIAMDGGLGRAHGVAVCDDRAYFERRITQIADEGLQLGGPSLGAYGEQWEIVEGYQGPGYGLATPEVWETIRWVAREEGLLLDPVYTGKAMHALICEVRAKRWGGRLLFWHTGGVFGLFGRGGEMMETR